MESAADASLSSFETQLKVRRVAVADANITLEQRLADVEVVRASAEQKRLKLANELTAAKHVMQILAVDLSGIEHIERHAQATNDIIRKGNL
eukprot:2992698-Pleurochrysis_carterae.AAC.1